MSRLRIPLGTQVVVRDATAPGAGRGIAGRVVRDQGTAYVVSLAGGRRVEVRDDQLSAVGQHSAAGEVPTPPHHGGSARRLVADRAIYAAAVGHRLNGLDIAADDTDIRCVYQAPTSAFWTLHKPPKHVAGPGPSWFSWEVERFCELALKANPTCLELLWSPLAVWVSDAGRELLDLRAAFLSQAIPQGFGAYVLAQFKKLEEIDRTQLEQRWPHVVHLLRLLMDGIALLRDGAVDDSVGDNRERLLSVLGGQLAWQQVEEWRVELQQQLDSAAASTFLPPEPDVARVDSWLSDLRRRDASR